MKKTKKNQLGGNDVIHAMGDLIHSMNELGKNIFNEVQSITHISSDINNAASSKGVPNQIDGPPSYDGPRV